MEKSLSMEIYGGASGKNATGAFYTGAMESYRAILPRAALQCMSDLFCASSFRSGQWYCFWACLLTVLTFGSCSKETPLPLPTFENTDMGDIERELLQIVNRHRADQGSIPLEFSPAAYIYAREHTDYMISKGSISHDNFPSRASRLSMETDAGSVGENVARGYPDASTAFKNWYSSGEHRKAMEGDFTHTAASVKMGGGGDLYYTQLFYR